MAITVSYADLFNGSYASRIQDALGSQGATAAITTSNGGYNLSITGTPTGSGLKAEARQAQSSGSSKPVSDTITLSAAAQAKLEQQTVAAQLLSADKGTLNHAAGQPAVTSEKSAPTSRPSSSSSTATIDVNDVSQLGQEDPTQVIKDTVSAAASDVASISTTQGFNQAAAENPQFISQFTSNFSSEDAASIQKAFSNGTLTVQPLSVAGLSLSGSSEAFTSDPGAGPLLSPPTGTGLNQREVFFGVGAISISWPTST